MFHISYIMNKHLYVGVKYLSYLISLCKNVNGKGNQARSSWCKTEKKQDKKINKYMQPLL